LDDEVVWIHLAQEKIEWRALVTTVMNLRGSTKDGKFPGQLTDL
jgi:hypothetical protein